jgi:O-succinylbenzoic acid--CoA ligase
VLPAGPPAWQGAIHAALHAQRPVADGLVVPTSGSTGTPVGVVLSAAAVRWSAAAVVARLGGPGSWLLALPPTHVAGLMVLARALVSGDSAHAVSGSFTDSVAGMPPGRRYTALVPTQVRRLLDDEPDALASFDAVLVGGAGLDDRLRARAESAGVRLVESYGMTETCGGCVHDGEPLPGVDVRLDEAGTIALSGPMLAAGYRRERGDVPVASNGWFATHDLGQWAQGRLRVVGRDDDVVISGGVSVPLAAVDALLAEHPDLADAVAVGVPDGEWGTRVVAVAVPRPGTAPTLADVRSFVAARAEPAYVPRDLVLVDDLARPAPGKVDRAGTAARRELTQGREA